MRAPHPLHTDASAAKAPDGSLVAHFTADLPKTPDQILGSKFNIIYAIGPLAPDGSLLPHPATGRPFGGTTLQLRQAGGAGAPQAAPAAEGASPAAPLPAAAPASAPERDRGVTNSGCQLSLSGRQLDFSACTHLDGIGSDTTLMWSLRPLGECGCAVDYTMCCIAVRLHASVQATVAVRLSTHGGFIVRWPTCRRPSCVHLQATAAVS